VVSDTQFPTHHTTRPVSPQPPSRQAKAACLYTYCGGRYDVRWPDDPDSLLDRHWPRRHGLVNWRLDAAYSFIDARPEMQHCHMPIYAKSTVSAET